MDPAVVKEPSEVEKAYAAALLDGEGSISPQFSRGYSLRVSITSTDFAVLNFLLVTWGGKIYASVVKPGRRPIWQWCLNGHKAKPFLVDVLPHMKIKRRQAELGLRFIETLMSQGRVTGGMSKETLDRRAEIALELQMINRYGSSGG